jgi:hypothetical protein
VIAERAKREVEATRDVACRTVGVVGKCMAESHDVSTAGRIRIQSRWNNGGEVWVRWKKCDMTQKAGNPIRLYRYNEKVVGGVASYRITILRWWNGTRVEHADPTAPGSGILHQTLGLNATTKSKQWMGKKDYAAAPYTWF